MMSRTCSLNKCGKKYRQKLVRHLLGILAVERPRNVWKDGSKIDLREIECMLGRL
jgi:hypothetical protein